MDSLNAEQLEALQDLLCRCGRYTEVMFACKTHCLCSDCFCNRVVDSSATRLQYVAFKFSDFEKVKRLFN